MIISLLVGATSIFAAGAKEEGGPVTVNIALANNPISQAMSKLVAVFIWNEFFLGFNLTGNPTATLPVFMSRFREQQGQFVAQLSASSTIAVMPAIILGWMTQKALVKGLTSGAVKG